MTRQTNENQALTDDEMRELERIADPPYEQEETDIM